MVKPVIILVAPQMGENIGAAARAMKNFGHSELRIVNPRDGWPNEKAESMAVGAINIIREAKLFNSLQEAIFDLEFLYATTAQGRDMNKEYIEIRDLHNDFLNLTSSKNTNSYNKIGVLFGRESSGLTNEEICFANKILTINTNPDFSSLNIAQAIMLVCYELFEFNTKISPDNNQALATKEELEYFFDHLFTELDRTKFFKTPDKRHHMTLNIRNIFSRIEKLSRHELQSLRGIISSLVKLN
jgi:tRNA/rRNA methyltransferase